MECTMGTQAMPCALMPLVFHAVKVLICASITTQVLVETTSFFESLNYFQSFCVCMHRLVGSGTSLKTSMAKAVCTTSYGPVPCAFLLEG